MLPDNSLSAKAYIAGFSFQVKSASAPDKLKAWELGGVALNDPSQGLRVKLWEGTLVIDRDTGVGGVYVEAPGVARTLLFSGADITEIDIAFDQNMNPFVAYQQGSAAKIYWYDPTIPGMTHTTLPAGSHSLRCTLDDKRQFNVGDSDIVLGYVRAGNLCVRYQRDRYSVETVLRSGIGGNARLVSMAMNTGSRLQFRLRSYELTDDPGALRQNSPFLAEVVTDFCQRAGISQNHIDVLDLWYDIVPGIKVNNDDGMDKPIDWLREIFFFDKAEYDKKIHFIKRGRQPKVRIPHKHLVEGSPKALKQELKDEKKLPRIVSINHLDPDAGHAKNQQTAERRSNLFDSEVKKSIDSQVVLTVDQAATAAMTRLKAYHNELIEYEFSTSLMYTELTVTDVIEVEDVDGAWHRMRLTERNEDNGIIEWNGVQDAGDLVYDTSRFGNTLPPPISTTPGILSPTQLEIINCSPIHDQDDELGLYIALAGETSVWTGAQLLYSVDGGNSYVEAYRTQVPSTIGVIDTDLLEEVGYEYQSNQSVEVTVNFPLASVTYDQMMLGQNLICIGDEMLQYQTAVLLGMDGALYRYRLFGLIRARYSTKPLHWPAGTRFVFMDDSVVFAQVQRSMIGTDITYKPVSFGMSEDEVVPTDYLFDEPNSQTEWLVADFEAIRNGSDTNVQWHGVARLGTDTNPFHSKYFAGYRVKFSDGFTFDTMDDHLTRVSAPPSVSVQVCALNTITGEGQYTDPILVP